MQRITDHAKPYTLSIMFVRSMMQLQDEWTLELWDGDSSAATSTLVARQKVVISHEIVSSSGGYNHPDYVELTLKGTIDGMKDKLAMRSAFPNGNQGKLIVTVGDLDDIRGPYEVTLSYERTPGTIIEDKIHVSIKHEEFGYATRVVTLAGGVLVWTRENQLREVQHAVRDMQTELGAKYAGHDPNAKIEYAGDFSEFTGVVRATPKPRNCKTHGNALVPVRNRETGEAALRCPVLGCTVILRKRAVQSADDSHRNRPEL